MDVNFELYKVFYHVGKTLSFSEAANRLYISQSGVSQGIKTLEEKMGCKLFFRSTKQVKLTQEGEILFKHIEQAFNFIKAGERNIQEIHTLEQGEVRIGASDTICKYYLLPYFKKFHRLYPNIKLQVTNRTSPKCVELLRQGSVDFSVINLPNQHTSAGMTIQQIREIEDVLVAGKPFLHLKDREVSLEELKEYPLMLLEKKASTREFFDAFAAQNEVHLIPEIELSSIDLLIELAKIGLGISFVMRDCVEKEVSCGELFTLQLKETLPKRELGIVTHRNVPLPIGALKFIELLI